ncbi:unnamed protein product [Didymodactylos carnosus]|uniref:Uncharacterized protein n=1 Tax=Didymodactylos carnosus TaxID=1234261 RepID=A0A813XC82_9BILA|nr:unnamed protein product [Didymodactylos carnosus]CAF3650377.1 unnamed protein product [Didymodactylos carnosus]
MDQLVFDLNAALNETYSKTITRTTKSKRRKKRTTTNNSSNSVNIACRSDVSDSTTQENLTLRMTCHSEGEDFEIPSKSDSTSRIDPSSRRRRRRPFKKPSPPIIISTSTNVMITSSDQLMKNRVIEHIKIPSSSNITNTSGSECGGNNTSNSRQRRRQYFSESSWNNNEMHNNVDTTHSSSSSFSITTVGKRKRSARASSRFIHNSREDLHRPLSSSMNECERTLMDDNNRTEISSSSSLNLSDSDPSPTSNEADDEQSDFPRDESVPHVVKWWKDKNNNAAANGKMLSSTDVNIEKVVNRAFTVMFQSSKTSFRNRIKSYMTSREILTGNRHTTSNDIKKYISTHVRRQSKLLRDNKRSYHNSYNHKRRKYCQINSNKTDETCLIPPMSASASNIGHQLFQKFEWESCFDLGTVSSRIITPVQVIYQNYRGGLRHEVDSLKTDYETKDDSFNEKMDG